MIHRIVFVLMISIHPQYTVAQTDLTHLFLKIDGVNTEKFELEFGKIEYDKDYEPRRIVDKTITDTEMLRKQLFATLAEGNTSEKLNILIHGIWADKKFAWRKMVQVYYLG